MRDERIRDFRRLCISLWAKRCCFCRSRFVEDSFRGLNSCRIFVIFADVLEKVIMSEKEMNSYRFLSGQEPSDEMLSQLMKEVAADARERRQKAADAHMAQMRRNMAEKKERWAERISRVVNG